MRNPEPRADTEEETLAPFRRKAVDFLGRVENCQGRVLVHCTSGCSRSVAAVLMHLMENHRVPLLRAHRHILKHRTVACPNEGFLSQLATMEVGPRCRCFT
ncbi:unnamed protein product [Discosporangium mesarthrocarpum]